MRAPPASAEPSRIDTSAGTHHASRSEAEFRLECAGEDLNLHGLLRPLGPQPSASTNSATSARGTASVPRVFRRRAGLRPTLQMWPAGHPRGIIMRAKRADSARPITGLESRRGI